jgi:hypothetical protein
MSDTPIGGLVSRRPADEDGSASGKEWPKVIGPARRFPGGERKKLLHRDGRITEIIMYDELD